MLSTRCLPGCWAATLPLSATSGPSSSRTTTWSGTPGSGPSVAPSPEVGGEWIGGPPSPGAAAGRGDSWSWLCPSPLQRWNWGGSAAAGTCPPAPRHQLHTDPKARGKPLRSGTGPGRCSPPCGTPPALVWRPQVGWRWGGALGVAVPPDAHPHNPAGPLAKARTLKKPESSDAPHTPRAGGEF